MEIWYNRNRITEIYYKIKEINITENNLEDNR